MTPLARALLALALTTCAPFPARPECPEVSYTPRGPVIAGPSYCPADACPLRCGDGQVCTRDDDITCEACLDIVTYMGTECPFCFLTDDAGVLGLDCFE